jgi:hypothetical protein
MWKYSLPRKSGFDFRLSTGVGAVAAILFLSGCEGPKLKHAPSTEDSVVSPDENASADASKICTGTTLDGVTGTAVCEGASAGTNSVATNVLAGTYFWDSAGVSTLGTMAERGSWNLNTTAFPGAGHFSAVTSTLSASNVCTGTQIFGSAGAAACIADTTGSAASAAQVLTGKVAWDNTGAKVTGSMADRGNWNQNTSAFPGAGYFSGLTSTLAPSNVCTGTQIFGAAGAAVCIADTTGTVAAGSQVLTGKVAWDNAGAKLTGTMANNGTWNLTQNFATAGGAGYYSAVSNTPRRSVLRQRFWGWRVRRFAAAWSWPPTSTAIGAILLPLSSMRQSRRRVPFIPTRPRHIARYRNLPKTVTA